MFYIYLNFGFISIDYLERIRNNDITKAYPTRVLLIIPNTDACLLTQKKKNETEETESCSSFFFVGKALMSKALRD